MEPPRKVLAGTGRSAAPRVVCSNYKRNRLEFWSGQSGGQASWGTPAAKSSMSWCASSSWYCTGGDFMK